jgi:hypothetical protein
VLAAPVLSATLGGTPRRDGAVWDHAPREECPVAAVEGRDGGKPTSPTGPVIPAGFSVDCTSCLAPPVVSTCAAALPRFGTMSVICEAVVSGDKFDSRGFAIEGLGFSERLFPAFWEGCAAIT